MSGEKGAGAGMPPVVDEHAGEALEAAKAVEKKERANEAFMKELGDFLPTDKLKELLGDRQITSGKIDLVAWHTPSQPTGIQSKEHFTKDEDVVLPYFMAELEVSGGGKIFVTSTPSAMDKAMAARTGVVMSKGERCTYNFDGVGTTVAEDSRGKTQTISGEQGKDMDGLRAMLNQSMPYEAMMDFNNFHVSVELPGNKLGMKYES